MQISNEKLSNAHVRQLTVSLDHNHNFKTVVISPLIGLKYNMLY